MIILDELKSEIPALKESLRETAEAMKPEELRAKAAELEKETVGDCVIQGPLALDGAISRRCAEHKGIGGPVAGQADVLLMPDLCSGNVLYKSIPCIAGLDVASTICGASAPVVITSRADAPGNKYRSILLSVLQAMA